MADRVVATGSVKLTADTGRLIGDIEAAFRRIAIAPLALQLDDARVRGQLDEIIRKASSGAMLAVQLDDTTARADIEDLAKAATKLVNVQMDVGTANGVVADLTRAATKTVTATVDTARARGELESLSRPIEVPVSVRTDGGTSDSFAGSGKRAGIDFSDGVIGGIASKAPQVALAAGSLLGGAKLVGGAEDFRVAMRRVSVELGLTDEQLATVRKSTIDLGNDAVLGAVSSGDAADGYLSLARAGLTLEQSQKAIKSALEFSIVSQKDAAEGTELFGQALNALKVPGSEAVRFVNEFVKADALAAGSTADLAESLFKAAPAFVQVFGKDSRNNLQASLASLSQVGVIGPRAGYAMAQLAQDVAGGNTTLAKAEATLTKAATQRGETFAKGATIFKDAKGNTREYNDILASLNNALGNRSAGDYAALTANLSDETKRALPQLLAFASAIDANATAISRAGDEQVLADQKAQAFAKSTDAISGAFETMSIAVGSKLLPAFDSFAQGFGRVAAGITAFFEGSGFSNFSARVQEILGAVTAVVGPFVEQFMAIIGRVDFGAIIAKAVQFGRDLAPIFQSGFEAVSAIVSKVVEVVNDLWDRFGSKLIEAARTAMDGVKLLISGGMDIIKGIFDTITGVLTGDWSKLWEGLKQIASGVWTTIQGLVKVGWGVIQAAFEGAKGTVSAAWSAVWNAAKTIFNDLWGGIRSGIDTALKTVAALVGGIRTAVANAFRQVWEAAKGAFSEVWGAISRAIESAANGVAAKLSSAVTAVKNFIRELLGIPREIVVNIVTRIPGATGNVANIVKQVTAKANAAAGSGGSFSGRALGGLITRPEFSLIGEDGPEVILPLSKPRRLLELLRLPQVYQTLQAAFGTLTSTGSGAILEAVRGGAIPTLRGVDPGAIAKSATAAVKDVYDAVNTGIDTNTANTLDAAARIGDAVDQSLGRMLEGLDELGGGFDRLEAGFDSMLAGLNEDIAELSSQLRAAVADMASQLQAAIAGLASAVAGIGSVGGAGRIYDMTVPGAVALTPGQLVSLPGGAVIDLSKVPTDSAGNPVIGTPGTGSPGQAGSGSNVMPAGPVAIIGTPGTGSPGQAGSGSNTLPFYPTPNTAVGSPGQAGSGGNVTIQSINPYVDPQQVAAVLYADYLNVPSMGGRY